MLGMEKQGLVDKLLIVMEKKLEPVEDHKLIP